MTPLLLACALAFAQPGPASARELFEWGRELYARGDYISAIDTFEAAWRMEPSELLLYDLALAYEKAGRLPEARDALARKPLTDARVIALRDRLGATARPAPVPVAPAPVPVPATQPGLRSIDQRLPTGAKNAQDTAVVVGLRDYAFVPDVPFADRDADVFQDFLLYTRGVPRERIRRLDTAAREQILAAVQQASSEVGAGGRLWVYFAGHGAAHTKTGERMILGDDVRPDPASFDARAVRVDEIVAATAGAKGEPLLLLDACFSGADRSGASLIPGARFAVPAYAVASSRGAQWNAAGANELSLPQPGTDHGAFTYWMVGALRGWADGEVSGSRDGKVTTDEAVAYVERALRSHELRSQRPVWLGDLSDEVLSTGAEAGPGF